jgi:DNA polymerase-1
VIPLCFDTETPLTRPGCKAPPMACMTWHEAGATAPRILHGKDPHAKEEFRDWLLDPNQLLVGHFVAYDMSVAATTWPDLIPLIFAAYEADRVTDTMLREKLWDIATGAFRGFRDDRGVWRKHDYSLEAVARRRAGIVLKKDGWRLRYGEFMDVPLDKWHEAAAVKIAEARDLLAAGSDDKDLRAIADGGPEEVTAYPLQDASATLAAYLSQERSRKESNVDPFADEFRQARASWWTTLMSAWGLRTRAEGLEVLKLQTEQEIAKLDAELMAAGLVRSDGSRDTKVATARMLQVMGDKYRKTKTGGVSLDRDACKESGDDLLTAYGERSVLKAVGDKDVPMLAAGVHLPVHTRIDIAASGRTTSSAPNVQNLRRLPGIREAFVPRPGKVFAQADYPGLELRTLAQVCLDLFGHSALGDMLNAGKDPHLAFAATLLGISYDEAKENKKRKDVDNARQVGKVFNFGSPGGLGAEKLVLFARKTYGVDLTVDDAKRHKQTWLRTFPEMRDFFKHVGDLCDNARGEATILQLRSNRIRGGTPYTAACNTYFQGLGSDATKAAGFAIAKACYVDRASPLFGSRIVNYVHDEFILETDDTPAAHDAAHELSRIMREAANVWLPSVPFAAPDPEPLLMRVWSKDAAAVTDAAGRLVPWAPTVGAA